MKVTCFALEADRTLRPVDEAAALAAWRRGGGPHWIDLRDGRPDEVAAWAGALGLDDEALALFAAEGDETRFRPLDGAVFVAFPVPSGEPLRPARFLCLFLDRLLVTVEERPGKSAAIDEAPVGRFKLPEPTTAGLVCGLLVLQANRLRRQVVALRAEGDRLTDLMDTDPAAVPVAEILALRRGVLSLGGVVDDQLAVMEVMRACAQPTLQLGHLAEPLRIALEISRATDRDVDRLDRRVGELHHRYESVQQELTNRRLGTLTVLSAIFMPLTLIAGIYGMNFDVMPGLRHPLGYFITLGVMALIAAALIWYFRGWWSRR
jgi:Mg2+ and Co2+ transporter CorA